MLTIRRNAHVTITILGLCLLLSGLWLGCTAQARQETPEQLALSATPGAAPGDTLNALTEAEREAGWQLLFDGRSLSPWRGYQQQNVPEGWAVQDSAIHAAGGGGGDLVTKEPFGSFELKFDWKIAEGGNSGVMYHVDEQHESAPQSGPEYQIIDDEGYDTKLEDVQKSGANYALHAPTEPAAREPGAWNQARLVVDGKHVEHWLNGEKVVSFEEGSADWKQRVAESKFAKWPSYASSEEGHLALQDHGDPVWFRNLKIRPLD